MAAEAELKREELKLEFDLKLKQMTAELALKREQMAAEMALKREQMQVDALMKRGAGAAKAEGVPRLDAETGIDGVRMGGEVG
jgi:hypothetical protein